MLRIAGQTARQIGLKFYMDTKGWPRSVMAMQNSNFFFQLKKKILTGNAGLFTVVNKTATLQVNKSQLKLRPNIMNYIYSF